MASRHHRHGGGAPQFREQFIAHQFRTQVETALESVRKILASTRNPTFPADTPHTYDDKYALAEFLVNLGLAAQANALECMGLDEDKMRTMRAWAADGRSVTLRATSKESCRFAETREREVESKHSYVSEKTSRGSKETKKNKVVTRVTEHFWTFSVE
jgi:hypothetical protein